MTSLLNRQIMSSKQTGWRSKQPFSISGTSDTRKVKMAVTSRTNGSGYGCGRVCGKAVFNSTSDPKYDHVAPIM